MLILATALLAAAPASGSLTQVFSLSQGPSEYSGTSVAICGDRLASGATGIDAVYVFEQNGGVWSLQSTVVPPPGFVVDRFGAAVALDGDTLLVGAPGGSAFDPVAFVYRWNGATWDFEASLDDTVFQVTNFGSTVALRGDTAVIGAPLESATGAVYAFTRTGTSWSAGTHVEPTLAGKGKYYGASLALDGDTLLVGAPDSNANHPVHVFVQSGSSWSQQAVIDPPVGTPFRYGAEVALSGDEAIVGATGYTQEAGIAYAFQRTGSSWALVQTILPSGSQVEDGFGGGLTMSPNLLAAATYEGRESVYVFHKSGSSWTEETEVTGPDPETGGSFGAAMAIEGQTIVVGAPTSGLGPYFYNATSIDFVPGLGGLIATDVARRVVRYDSLPNSVPLGKIVGSYALTGLTHDPVGGMLWGCNPGTDDLWSIDPSTWTATLIGTFDLSGVQALAYTPYGLYGLDNATDQLVLIDTGTAACTPVGALGFDKARGLAWDPTAERFYACTKNRMFYTVDRTTGAGTLLGSAGTLMYESLAFDPIAGSLYVLRSDSSILEVDPVTLGLTPLDPIYVLNSGSAYVFEGEPYQTYCTAGTSASGCQALLSATGIPSATAPSGFTLHAPSVEGQKLGLYYFGTAGRKATPFGNGSSLRCVGQPAKRGSLIDSGGTLGTCDGSFDYDLNADWNAKPAHNFGAGAIVDTQLWYRDPLNTSNQSTSFSDGIEFTVCP